MHVLASEQPLHFTKQAVQVPALSQNYVLQGHVAGFSLFVAQVKQIVASVKLQVAHLESHY